MPLRRLHGLSAAVSDHLRRSLSTAASHPAWVMMDNIKLRPSSAQRASAELAAPPGVSHLVVPDHLIDLDPETPVDPDSDQLRFHIGHAGATSGDGLLLLDFMDLSATAPVVATHRSPPQRKLTGFSMNLHSASGATQERRITGYDMDPDITRFVCNPVTGQLFRLPDIDGTKKTKYCQNLGLLTASASAHGNGTGPPDRYAVAWIGEDGDGDEEKQTFVMRRFLSQTGEWEKLERLPSPLPLTRPLGIHTHHEVLAFAGRIWWWVDLSWGAVSADPFSDRPELRIVELPKGRLLPLPSSADEITGYLAAQGMYRRMGVSEGRLRYVEISPEPPFVFSNFALDDDGCSWTLEYQNALGRAPAGHPLHEEIPWIGAIDPLNARLVYFILGDYVFSVDMHKGVFEHSHLGEHEYQQRTVLMNCLLPCVLPPWLGSSQIPSTDQ
ncbi:hypothetical protein EJB05_35995, partial [Eragrostis curvula]